TDNESQKAESQDGSDSPNIEADRQDSGIPEVIEHLEDATREIQSSFENLDRVTRKSRTDVNSNSSNDAGSGDSPPETPATVDPDSEVSRRRQNQKTRAKAAEGSSSLVREPRKHRQKQAQVSRVTDEAIQSIELLLVTIEDLAVDESVRKIIRKEKAQVLDSQRQKAPEETFAACRRAFLVVSDAFSGRDDNEIHVAINEVLSAIDNAIDTVEAAFQVVDSEEDSDSIIIKAINEATIVIRTATQKIRKVIKAIAGSNEDPVTRPQGAKTFDNSRPNTDVFQDQKVAVEPSIVATPEKANEKFRAEFAKGRLNNHVEFDSNTIELINDFLAKIESRIEDKLPLVVETKSVATLKNELDKFRGRMVRSADRLATIAINDIADVGKGMILSPTANHVNSKAMVIGMVCMEATKSVLVESIVDSIVYGYEGSDVLEVKEASTLMVMQYIKEVAKSHLNSL
ncbi:MAG: hypothetical protein OXI30_04545, partial [Chloroflexota bacterium]|nr:hypothetical protein [Chloroflexota bacterium]